MAGFKKILFPTDFSPNAARALFHASRLTDVSGGEVIVQHVVNSYFDKHPHVTALFDIHEHQKFLDLYAEMNVAAILPKHIRTVISEGKPAEEIAKLANSEMVDLIVMGSAKGVVTNKVLRLTNRPVLAVSGSSVKTPAKDAHKINRILVATDFSEHSRKVVKYAFDLKRIFGGSIYLLHVVETAKIVEFAVRQAHLDTIVKMREWADKQLLNLTPDEFVRDASVVRLVETGSPGDVIADVASEIGADLTILGTHDSSAAQRFFLGGTTDEVLTKSSTPILAMRS
jgi:nucleotide-binding universal stress UspA family protein